MGRNSTEKAHGATNYAWPRSRMLDQIDGMIPMAEIAKVYCKDTGMELLREPYRRMPQHFCEEVNLLVDIINSCDGIYSHFDGYDSMCVDNSSLWVQKTIEQSDFVLTVCSPMLYQVLRDAHHKLVEMLRGKLYPDAVVNYISPHKFIPVFLDMPARDEWVPVNLQTSTYYELYVLDFATAMGDTKGMLPLAFESKMSRLLEDPKITLLIATLLIATLRKESVNPRPLPPPRLIRPVIFGRPLFNAIRRQQEDESPNEILGEDGEKDKRKPQARQVRRADTNIIVVNFGVLKKSGEIHTGDCVVCTNVNCGTALSHLSLLKEGLHQNETVWQREFCGTEDTATEEVPKKETILTPPPPSTTGSRDEQSLVIFCIDISGSMGVTTERLESFFCQVLESFFCQQLRKKVDKECDKWPSGDLTSDDATDPSSEQLSSDDSSSVSEEEGSEEAEARLAAEAETLDCTAGQTSLGTNCGREQSSLQSMAHQLSYPGPPKQDLFANDVRFSVVSMSISNWWSRLHMKKEKMPTKMEGCSDKLKGSPVECDDGSFRDLTLYDATDPSSEQLCSDGSCSYSEEEGSKEMLRGKFYPDAIMDFNSLLKFISVFLDMPARDEWVPVNLTYYKLYVRDFATAMGATEGMHPLAFESKMSKLLEDPRFEKITSLIATLRKESVNPRPLPPPRLIRHVIFGRPLFNAIRRQQEDENPNEILGEDGEKDKRKPQARQVRRADTNIIVVDFGVLKKSGEIHTGDCVVCTNVNCGTALSHLSLLKEGLHQNETVWQREFCGTEDTATEEVPKKETILTPPPPSTTGSRDEQSLVIFCIDISGSMGVTTERLESFFCQVLESFFCQQLRKEVDKECDKWSFGDLTSDDATDPSAEQLSSNDSSSVSEEEGSEEADARLATDAETVDGTAGQTSLGTNCGREQSSLQSMAHQLSYPGPPKQDLFANDVRSRLHMKKEKMPTKMEGCSDKLKGSPVLCEIIVQQGKKIDKLCEKIVQQGKKIDKLHEKIAQQVKEIDKLHEKIAQRVKEIDKLMAPLFADPGPPKQVVEDPQSPTFTMGMPVLDSKYCRSRINPTCTLLPPETSPSGQEERAQPLKEFQLTELFPVGSHKARRKVVLIEGVPGCGRHIWAAAMQGLYNQALTHGFIESRSIVSVITGPTGTGKTHVQLPLNVLKKKPAVIRISTAPVRALFLASIVAEDDGQEIAVAEQCRIIAAAVNGADILTEAVSESSSQETVEAQQSPSSYFPPTVEEQPAEQTTAINCTGPLSTSVVQSTITPATQHPSLPQVTTGLASTSQSDHEPDDSEVREELVGLVLTASGFKKLLQADRIYLFDTGGQVNFHDLIRLFLRHASITIFFVKSFEQLNHHSMIEFYDNEKKPSPLLEEVQKCCTKLIFPAAPLVIQFPDGLAPCGLFCSLIASLLLKPRPLHWELLPSPTNRVKPECVVRNLIKFELPRGFPGAVTLIDSYTHFVVNVAAPEGVCSKLCLSESAEMHAEKEFTVLSWWEQMVSKHAVTPSHTATSGSGSWWTCSLDPTVHGQLEERHMIWLKAGRDSDENISSQLNGSTPNQASDPTSDVPSPGVQKHDPPSLLKPIRFCGQERRINIPQEIGRHTSTCNHNYHSVLHCSFDVWQVGYTVLGMLTEKGPWRNLLVDSADSPGKTHSRISGLLCTQRPTHLLQRSKSVDLIPTMENREMPMVEKCLTSAPIDEDLVLRRPSQADCDSPDGPGEDTNRRPPLLRELSFSAEYLPDLCLNNCPLTPSLLVENRTLEVTALSPLREQRSHWIHKPKLGLLAEKNQSTESLSEEDSNASSRSTSTASTEETTEKRLQVEKHSPPVQLLNQLHSCTSVPESSYDSNCSDTEGNSDKLSRQHRESTLVCTIPQSSPPTTRHDGLVNSSLPSPTSTQLQEQTPTNLRQYRQSRERSPVYQQKTSPRPAHLGRSSTHQYHDCDRRGCSPLRVTEATVQNSIT